MYTKLHIYRAAIGKGKSEEERPATLEITISNVGNAPVALAPEVSVLVYDLGSNTTSSATATFRDGKSPGLPMTLKQGENAIATAVIDSRESDAIFGANLLYKVVLRTVDNQLFVSDNLVGPINNSTAYCTMLEYDKYQSDINFNSKPVFRITR